MWLAHYGIPNMKWGIRRFQNEDGSLTPAGRERYLSKDNRQNALNNIHSGWSKVQNKYLRGEGNYIERERLGLSNKHKNALNKIWEASSEAEGISSEYLSGALRAKPNLIDKVFKTKKLKEYNENIKDSEEWSEIAGAALAIDADEYINSIPEKDRDMARAYVGDMLQLWW